MSNLYQLKTKPENLEEIHILISERILALVLHYGLTHFLNTCQDVNVSQYDTKDSMLPTHLKNLIRTYGRGDVNSLISVMYYKQLNKKRAS